MAVSFEGERIVMLPLGKTLLDLRGSVPATGAQDFAHIRRAVLEQRAEKAAGHDR